MRDLAELNLLIRLQAEFPEGMKLVTDYFRDGWHRVRTGSKKGLEKKVKARNWYFIRSPKGISASGTGTTPQQAVARAFDHALAEVCAEANAIEVSDIHSTQYPWFWLARVSVSTYQIQRDPVVAVPYRAASAPIHALPPRALSLPSELAQNFAGRPNPGENELVAPGGFLRAGRKGTQRPLSPSRTLSL